MTNLRKKVEPDSSNPLYLFTENGVGYRMAENHSEDEHRTVYNIYPNMYLKHLL